MLGVYLGVGPGPPGKDHTCRRDWLLAATTQGNGGARASRRGTGVCGGTEPAAGRGVDTGSPGS